MSNIVLPQSFEGIKSLSDEDKAILSVIVASGKNQGAYYRREGDKYTLHKTASLDKDNAGEFAAEFTAVPENAATVKDVAGITKGLFVFKQSPYPKEFSQAFIGDYITEPAETQEAKLAVAQHVANAQSYFLSPPAQQETCNRVKNVLHPNHKWKMDYLGGLFQLTAAAYDAGMEKPNDEAPHIVGFNKFMSLALTELMPPSNSKIVGNSDLNNLISTLGGLHNAGKLQLSAAYLRPWRDVLTKADQQFTPEKQAEIKALKKAYFDRVNHNHPILAYLLLSNLPNEASAAALHHLSLYRDQDTAEARIKAQPWNLINGDVAASDITPLSKLMFVAEVADAMLNNERQNPILMLDTLLAKTKVTNHLGMPLIEPALLGFLLENKVVDQYVSSKQVEGKQMQITKEYEKRRDAILAELALLRDDPAVIESFKSDPLLLSYQPKGKGLGQN